MSLADYSDGTTAWVWPNWCARAMRDRDIDHAALQLFGGFAAVQWQNAQVRAGRLA